MKRSACLILMVCLHCLILTGCTPSPPKEAVMKEHFLSACSSLSNEVSLDEFNIIKRQTDKNSKSDISHCEIKFRSDNVEYTQYYVLSFNYYDKGGWILDEITEVRDQWTCRPLKGVDKDIELEKMRTDPQNYFRTSWDTIVPVSYTHLLESLQDHGYVVRSTGFQPGRQMLMPICRLSGLIPGLSWRSRSTVVP